MGLKRFKNKEGMAMKTKTYSWAARIIIISLMLIIGGVSNSWGSSTGFSDDFSTDPNTNGKWTIYRYSNDTTNEVSYDSTNKAVYLTKAVNSKGSAMFANYDLTSKDWEASFSYKVGGGSGADGFVFMFYKNETSYSTTALSAGGCMGFNVGGGASCGSVSGYGVEFDNSYNGDFSDPSSNHIAIIEDKVSNHLTSVSNNTTEDNSWHTASIKFSNGQVTVSVDNSQVLSYTIQNMDYTYTGVGFSSGTGGANNNHIIKDFNLTIYDGSTSTSTILVLTRNSSSLDSEETKVTDFLTQNGYSYDTADATDISNGSVSASSYKVIYFRTGSEPTGYNSTSVISAIQSAVEGGSSLIVEYYGNYLVKHLGWGSVTSASWSPAVYDKLAYVKSITSHEIFDGISTWDPPTEPDKEEQYIWSLNKTGSCTCKDLSLTSAEKIEYWELYITYGWSGQSTTSDYCQSWGGCESDRSVRSNSIRYATHGSGKVIHPYGAGIGHSNCNASLTLGTAGTSLMKNLINWAGAGTNTPSIDVTLTPPSNTSVSKGGAVGPFSISIANNTSSSYSIYVSPWLYTSDGNWLSLGYIPLTLSANNTHSANILYLPIPSFASTGTYYYWVNIYDTSWSTLDYDYFSFTVTSSSSPKFGNESQDWKMSGWPDN